MTLPDIVDQMETVSESKDVNIGLALQNVLIQACADDTMISGTYQCVQTLQMAPETIMVCVLPESNKVCDITMDIQAKLIEAFCWENEIRLLKVSDDVSLETMLKANDCQCAKSGDFSCLLVQYPNQREMTEDEANVIAAHRWMMSNDVYPIPTINIAG